MSEFPSNKVEALTMLYMQNRRLAGQSPEQLVALYQKTYKTIDEEFKKDQKPCTVATHVDL